MLNELFEHGVAVKILDGIAAGEHTERSLIVDLSLALAEDRRRDIVRKTRNGLEAHATDTSSWPAPQAQQRCEGWPLRYPVDLMPTRSPGGQAAPLG